MTQQLFRWLRPHPLRASLVTGRPPPFFLVSAGRSGTTLLRAILSQNEQVCIPPESGALGRIISQFKSGNRRLPWTTVVNLFCAEMAVSREFCDWEISLAEFRKKAFELTAAQRSLAHLIDLYFRQFQLQHAPGTSRWGDKTPHNVLWMRELDAVFPEGQYIHIVRDGRDVVASYLKLGWVSNLEEACDWWSRRVRAALDYSRRNQPRKFIEIRYEDLVREPGRVTEKLCGFLQIAYDASMLDTHEATDRFRGDRARPELHPRLQQPINANAVGRWKTFFSAEQRDVVNQRLGNLLHTLGLCSKRVRIAIECLD